MSEGSWDIDMQIKKGNQRARDLREDENDNMEL